MTLARPEVLVGELAGVGHLARHVEAAGVAQRRLLLEVPARPAGLDRRRRVGVDDLRGGDHRVGQRLALHRDAVLDLGAHHPAHAHGVEPTRGRGRCDGKLGSHGTAGPIASLPQMRPTGRCRRAAGRCGCEVSVCAGPDAAGCSSSASAAGSTSARTRPRSTGVDAVEPSDVGLAAVGGRVGRARRCRSSAPGWTGSGSDAADASYDAVLSTFTLCTIPDVGRGAGGGTPGAAAGRRRALPRARARARRRRRALAAPPRPAAGPVAGGCHLSRDMPGAGRGRAARSSA